MLTEPRIEVRSEKPYAAIVAHVTMAEISTALPPLIGQVFGWLAAHGVAPAGPPFFQYRTIDMDRKMEIAVGVPVAKAVSGDGRIEAGAFPAGRYATVVYTGPYHGLMDATRLLLDWAEANGVRWQATETDAGTRWGSRTEFYRTDPAEEPNPERWETELAFLAADT